MGRKIEADEEHTIIHRDNPEETGRVASSPSLVLYCTDEIQSERQMALIVWKCLVVVGGVEDKAHYHPSLHHMAHPAPFPSLLLPPPSCLITVHCSPSMASEPAQ